MQILFLFELSILKHDGAIIFNIAIVAASLCPHAVQDIDAVFWFCTTQFVGQFEGKIRLKNCAHNKMNVVDLSLRIEDQGLISTLAMIFRDVANYLAHRPCHSY